ncbi:MAG: ATP-dependent helicase HrpB [Planctomycetota bacterium]
MDVLPIDAVLPELLAALRLRGAVALRAPTGAGKTTRVPPALIAHGLAGDRKVVVLEPRRIAARAAARRMADERGSALGDEIGYHVRFDRRASRRTRILVVTEGVLLRQLQSDPFLDDVGAVVFDEFHERNIDSDLALAMVRRLQAEVRPDLKIVVMSATLAVEPVAQFLGDCPRIEASGRQHPVTIEHSELAANLPLEERIAHAVEATLARVAGDVLVFLPGVGEIRAAARELEALARSHACDVRPLYGDLPAADQDQALRRATRRKIVLATNVAESSVTVEGVEAVIDSGLARIKRFDPAVGLDRLELTQISRAAADQRAGRAGRERPGVCLRLWSRLAHRGLREHDEPELLRVDLAGPVLELRVWGEPDPARFAWFEAPPPRALERAEELLELLGASTRASGVTTLGRDIAALPLHPRLGRLVLEGQRLGHGARLALVAALLAERDPTRGTAGDATSNESDVLARVRLLEEFDRRGGGAERLNVGAARQLLRARDQLVDLLHETKDASTAHTRAPISADEAVLRALLAAYPDRVARSRDNERRGVLVGGRGVRLGNESTIDGNGLYVCVDIDAGRHAANAEALVRQASHIEEAWLPTELIRELEELRFDPTAGRVEVVRRRSYLDLALAETRSAPPRNAEVASVLAAAAGDRMSEALTLDEPEFASLRTRIACLNVWLPETPLPDFSDAALSALLPELALGCISFADLRRLSLVEFLRARLTHAQSQSLDREAPERIAVPSGSRVTLRYEVGRPPVLAARIQELFGLAETPRIARGRVPVLLHLLAPNGRPQQITDDLRSFWNTTYQQVRKELRRRYPRHAWPEDPWNATPERRPRSRRESQ